MTRRRTTWLLAVCAVLAPVALATPASASSTGTEVVYVVADDDSFRVVLLDLGTRRTTTLVDEPEEWLTDPELSPDGQTVVFSATDERDGTFGLSAVSRDGTGLHRLTAPPSTDDEFVADIAPSWAPDGRTLLFTRVRITFADEQLHGDLLTVPAGGGGATPLPGGSNALDADWSPDGTSVVAAAGPVDLEAQTAPLTRIDPTTGTRTPLGASGSSPAWSPDGSTIAYSSYDESSDTGAIGTVPASGGTGTILPATRAAQGITNAPAWSPDGQSIVYASSRYDEALDLERLDLWAVDRSGQRAGALMLTDAEELSGFVHGPVPTAVRGAAAAGFTAVSPQRLLDTRTSSGGRAAGPVGPGETVELTVAGVQTAAGAVPADATAVVLTVTATGGTAGTDVRAYPTGSPAPTVSNLNAAAGATVPNLVTVPVGTEGRVTLRNNSGSVHLIADLAGWYSPGRGGDGFAPVDPARLLDTRQGVGSTGRVGPGGTLDLRVTGSLASADGGTVQVPEDATAVVLNVTGTQPTASTDVRVYPRPADGSVPEVSNLNLRPGQTFAGLVTVAVGEQGFVRLRNSAGSTHLLADIAGYYSPAAPGRFVAADPVRLLDTRDATGAAPIPLRAGGFLDLWVAGARGIPAQATAALVNLTATGVSASTDVRAYPASGSSVPTVSNLNVTRGTTRANLTVVKPGEGGRVRIRNSAGSVHLIGDLAGWFVPAG
jgi:WD40 repeat protein